MKRIISVLLSLIIITSCTMAYAGEMGAEFSVDPIPNNKDSNKLTLNITLQSPLKGGTLIIAFYTDGACTRVITCDDISTTNTIKLEDVKYTYTPDEIKLMIWEKGRIKPLSSAQNGLTDEVCEKANAKIFKLLDNLLPTTEAIRKLLPNNHPNKDEIIGLLDPIDACANKAKKGEYGKNELLTAEYCKREFKKELIEIEKLFSESSEEARNLLWKYYQTQLDAEFPNEGYSDTIGDFMGFFNVKIF